MAFLDWLSRWLAQHPLKSSSESDGADFTAGVMTRVRAAAKSEDAREASAFRFGLRWPRLAASVALAAAAVVAVGVLQPLRPGSPSATILGEAAMLAELDESSTVDLPADDAESLAQELERQDMIMLAEAPDIEATWLTQTLQMLDQLNEELPDDAAGAPAEEEEWLKELESLDESELATRS